MRRRYATPLLALALTVAGCNGPVAKLTAPTEGVIKGRQDAGQLRTLRLRGADGKPIAMGQLQLDGKSYPIKDGVVQIPEALFQAAQKAGALVLLVPGYAPVRVPPEALVAGAVTLAPLGKLGEDLALAGNAVATARGELKLAFGAGMLPGSAKISLASYRPELAAPNAAGFQATLQQLYGAAGKAAPTGCDGPIPCPPVQQALGIAVAADAALQGGQVQVSVDLATLLRGWDGTGTAPWVTDPGSWTAAQIADAQAALRILQTFQAVDASLRQALQATYGLTLTGTVLSFPVAATPDALAGGFLRVAVPGSELLGTRLEVTLTTPAATALPTVPDPVTIAGALGDEPGVPASALALATAAIPTADKTGKAATLARVKAPPIKGKRAGTTIQAGMPLASDPADVGAGPADLGAQPPAALAGVAPVPLDLGSLPGTNPTVAQVLSNNGSTVLSNNGGAFVPGPVPGLLANNGSTVIATAGGDLLSNNGGTLTAMTPAQLISSDAASSLVNTGGGGFQGFPYVPFVPAIAKFKLFDLGVPTPPAARVSAKGVLEYLWPGGLKLRAIDVAGNALTAWTTTMGDGGFDLPIQGHTPPVFFIEAVAVTGGIHLYSQVYAPGSQRGLIAVDSATSMMAISTIHLANFLPAEQDRLAGVQATFTDQLAETTAMRDQLASGQPRTAARLAYQAGLLTEDLALAQARTAELGSAAGAFTPYRFLADRNATYAAMDPTAAKVATSSTTTAPVYQKMYDLTTAGALAPQSIKPIGLDSPF